MTRCVACGRRIWPWQRLGWFVRRDGSRITWHGDCWTPATTREED